MSNTTVRTYERCGLVKRKVIHRDNLRRGAERDAVPSQKPRNFQVTRRWQVCNQNEIGWLKHESIIRLLPDCDPITPRCLGLI